MESVSELLDLHPRVAYDLTQRGLLWTNEYYYEAYGEHRAGSIDFLAVEPATGEIVVIECKTSIQSLTKLESQINRYCAAVDATKLRKEVYAFNLTMDESHWLAERGIQSRVVTIGTPMLSLSTPYQVWQDIQTIFKFWNYGFMLPRARFGIPHPLGWFVEEDWMRWDRTEQQVSFYRKCLESGDFSDYQKYLQRDEWIMYS